MRQLQGATLVMVCGAAFLAGPSLLLPGLPSAFAQPTQPVQPVQEAQPVPAADAQALALLARVKESWSRVTAFSMTAKATSEGYTDRANEAKATLAGAKAQVGDWKLALKEETARDADAGTNHPHADKPNSDKPASEKPAADKSDAQRKGIEITYDGATARSMRHKDKAVVQRTFVKVAQLRDFFTLQEGAVFVPWALIDPDVLSAPAFVALTGTHPVGDHACIMLEISDEPPAVQDQRKDDGRPRESIILYVSEKTALVHRIDTVQQNDKSGKKFIRTLVLDDIRLNDDAVLQDFAPPTPDGYAVRTRGGGGVVRGGGGAEGGGKLGGGVKPSEEKKDGSVAGGANPQAANQAGLPHGITWAHDARTLKAGSTIPQFSLKNPKGDTITNDSYKGKVLVIDFWGTWCPPCRAAMPALQKVHEKFAGKDVAVIGFNMERDPSADPAAFKKKNKYTYDLLLEADDLLTDFKVSGFPTFYVVAPDGTVVWGGVGLGGPPGVQRPTPRQYVEYLEETLSKLVEGELKKLEDANAAKK